MNPVKKETPNPHNQDIRRILLRYLPYWPVFTGLFLLGMTLSWLYLQSVTPLYEAACKILIRDEKKGTQNVNSLEEIDLLQSKKIVENETDVVRSRPLLYEVIKKLHMYAPVYKEKKFRNRLVYTSSPVIIEISDPENLREALKIKFKYDAKKQVVIIRQQAYALSSWQKTPYGHLRFSPNEKYTFIDGNEEYSFSLLTLKSVARGMENKLKATATTKLSSIIMINYRDEDPRKAEDVLNTLVATYIKEGDKDKNNLAANTLAFLEARLKIVEKELGDIEQKKQQYTSQKGAFNIGRQGTLFLENVSANDRKMSEINMQLSVLNEVENYVASKDNSGGVVPSTLGVTEPLLSELVNKLYNAELEYEALKNTTAENNPILLSIRDRVDKIKPNISEMISNQRRGLLAGRNNIAATNGMYASELSNIPRTERELVDIDRQQNIKNGIYTFLLQKKEETALSRQYIVPESRTISYAESTDFPVSPRKTMIYGAAFIISLLLGIGIIMARETFNDKIMFRHEIENSTGLPVIGEISTGGSPDPIVISDDKKTFIAEQFRRLRITLDYLDFDKAHHKKILVTSAISGEGKSFIALNLALTLALTGKKVILLDFDLNNPSLNNKLNISRNKGITDYLLHQCPLEEIIFPTDLNPNLSLISTGHLPHNPTELLLNGKTEVLLNQLDKLFDYIVIDTAPVIPVTDAYILSKHCDATLYIIRHGYTPKVFVERIDENNKMNKLHNVGIVFNSVSARGLGNNNYGYGYGYGYTFENSRKGRYNGHAAT
ncbi:MAG: polysaccharide biosynthesis tyrosine autokinase [Ferruginibacter sp.]